MKSKVKGNGRKYGSLRKYKKFLRERGDFHNPSEQIFENLLGENNVNFIRKGYPDYLIMSEDGEIIGFVEVKPSLKSRLSPSQERFKRFCKRYGIPFYLWIEGDSLPFTYNGKTLGEIE